MGVACATTSESHSSMGLYSDRSELETKSLGG